MKIATYNINGINGRIANLLRWLEEAEPDVVCLQELKCEDHKFPEHALLNAGYHAISQGAEKLERRHPFTLRGDPGNTAGFRW